MINRNNWKQVKSYLAHRAQVEQVSVSTLKLDEARLRHLLEWADETPFREAPQIRPNFSEYLKRARLDDPDKPLSKAYLTKIIRTTKRFFSWLMANRRGFKGITSACMDSLKPPRSANIQQEFKAVTIEEVHRMVQAPAKLLWEMRIRAAAVEFG